MKIYPYHRPEDILLGSKLDSVEFLSPNLQDLTHLNIEAIPVFTPDDSFKFLHEAAIIEFKGVLYASWYNCVETELRGYTPICGKRSYDNGKTWTEMEIIAQDESCQILYCPPVYGICDGKLYLLMNQMVGADLIHSLDLYVLNEQTDSFELVWSRPIPFKLNTNVVTLPNGKLLLPGRVAELDGFPNTPAVLISDSGKIDAEWRLVKIAPDGALPDGDKLIHPEISVIIQNHTLYMFNRNDRKRVPLVYLSKDWGESWSPLLCHDIPYINSKIYTGSLSNHKNFLIANEYVKDSKRSRLVAYFTDKDTMEFNKRLVLTDYPLDPQQGEPYACHYPAVCESNGKLYIIASIDYQGVGRGAILLIVNIEDIDSNTSAQT